MKVSGSSREFEMQKIMELTWCSIREFIAKAVLGPSGNVRQSCSDRRAR